MRIALLSDIHANPLALKAALDDIRKRRSPDRIISLGDQVNFGPAPRETLSLLADYGVVCLHGNHERYVLSAMAGDPAYDGANFSCVRFSAERLRREEITFPMTLDMDGVIFCHAMPDDDRFPVWDPEKALPLLREMTFDRPTHIICGHGHNPSYIRAGNVTIDCIGAVGCMDDAPAGVTIYTMLTLDRGGAALQPFVVPYDTRPLKAMFRTSGLAAYCPVMARVACCEMTDNVDYLMPFAALASRIARERGETQISRAALLAADAVFPWPGGVGTADYWRSE